MQTKFLSLLAVFLSFNMAAAVTTLGYNLEGPAARVFLTQELSTVPLFRMYSAGATDHFYTLSAAERDNAAANLGYSSEGTAAFIYPTQVCGSVPLFRLYSSAGTDHFYTTSAAERNNAAQNLGYNYEGVAGFVLQ
ncbi:hypothetical protein B0H10DRAFT_1961770 [Mycena sp. CBHHK59/15]|nr:hypothetical protein B0H10DRAFT_1961770 [Mycena sp. CBHHK59/15]